MKPFEWPYHLDYRYLVAAREGGSFIVIDIMNMDTTSRSPTMDQDTR
jgi:hypothetical protein